MVHHLECNDTQYADSTFVEDHESGRPSRVPGRELFSAVFHSGRDLARSPFGCPKFDHRVFVVYNTLASYPFYAVHYRLKPTTLKTESSSTATDLLSSTISHPT